MLVPLVFLAFLSVVGGFIEIPDTLGDVALFSNFLQPVFNEQPAMHASSGTESLFQIVASIVSLIGIFIAYYFFLRKPQASHNLVRTPTGAALQRFWFSGWGFDWLYEKLFINPFLWIAKINKSDFIDSGYTGMAAVNRGFHALLSKTQTGNIRWYAMGIADRKST